MAGGVTLGKFCIFALLVSLLSSFSRGQAPVRVRCLDKLCKEHIGHGEASQDYIGDEKIKLKFNQGDNLTIVGISDEFFLARAENSDIGLVAKRFIKRERITGKPEVDVDVSSLNRLASVDDEVLDPTPSDKSVVDQTHMSDPEVSSGSPSSDMTNGEDNLTGTVATPALPEKTTSETMVSLLSKVVYTSFFSAIEPSVGSLGEAVQNTEAAPQDDMPSRTAVDSSEDDAVESRDETSQEIPQESKPDNAEQGETSNKDVVPAERQAGGTASPELLPDKSVSAFNNSAQQAEDEVEAEAETEAVADKLVKESPPLLGQETPTTASIDKSAAHEHSEEPGVAEADTQNSQKLAGSDAALLDEESTTSAPQKPEVTSTESPAVVQSKQTPPARPTEPLESSVLQNSSGIIKGIPEAAEPAVPDSLKKPEAEAKPSNGPATKMPQKSLSPSNVPPEIDDSSAAAETHKLPEPKVTFGKAAPKDLRPPPKIRPTTSGHNHFHTRNAHGHSHGHAHGHSHGHSHVHEHEHLSEHEHEHAATRPEQQNHQSHSYPGEKPDMLTLKVAELAEPARSSQQVVDDKALPSTEKPSSDSLENIEPAQYKINTVEQTCERSDGVGCGGEPVSKPTADTKPPRSALKPDDSAIREYVGLVLSMIPEPLIGWLLALEENGVSSHVVVLTFLCGILASFLLVFFSCITQSSKESALHDCIARLEQQLFSLKKEREVLLENSEHTTHVPDEILERHDEEIRALQNRTSYAEQEFACAKESIAKYQEALREAQETLAEVDLERQAEREKFDQKQEELMEELNELRIVVENNNERASSFDTLLAEKDVLMNELRNTNTQLLQEAQIWDERLKELSATLDEVTRERDRHEKQSNSRLSEIESLKVSLKSLSVLEKAREATEEAEDEDDVIARLLDVQATTAENESLKEKNSLLEGETAAAKAQLDKWRLEVESLKNEVKQALKLKQDSEQRLQVLSDYFKDKELTLQRDVVKQETLRQQKENDALGINEQLDLYREQNFNLQSQMTSIREELEVCERRYKRQLMEQEKKAHDNWMAFKNATKTIEELQGELQVLRQQLIQFQKERETAERATANLPQDRPKPPPPLPLPRGVTLPLPPMPLPNGVFKDLPSPPMARYIEGARRTPPVGVPLPSVLYQTKTLSSRHSSDHSVRSGGSRGGIMSPDLRRSSNHRKSDRGDRSRDSNR